MLWERFEQKALALGASVIFADDEGAAARTVVDAPPDEVVCGAELAVAETGSVVVSLPNAERGKALLAERLWLVVSSDCIVANLDQALERMGAIIGQQDPGNSHYVTLMSGPSRTADIERTLTIGVHGPRALVVVVVGDRSAHSARH